MIKLLPKWTVAEISGTNSVISTRARKTDFFQEFGSEKGLLIRVFSSPQCC